MKYIVNMALGHKIHFRKIAFGFQKLLEAHTHTDSQT
jgi:hypothetical protein